MRLEKFIIRKKRRYLAICRCEFCGETVMRDGYDSEIFQAVQIPEMKCPTCGRASNEKGEDDEQ